MTINILNLEEKKKIISRYIQREGQEFRNQIGHSTTLAFLKPGFGSDIVNLDFMKKLKIK